MKKRSISAKTQARKITELATVRYSKINHTIPVILRRIKHKRKRCEDCPKTVSDRRLEATCVLKPTRHWVIKCTKCDLFLDRDTGKYALNWTQAHQKAITKSGFYQSKEYKDYQIQRMARKQQVNRECRRRYVAKQKALKSLNNTLVSEDSDK